MIIYRTCRSGFCHWVICYLALRLRVQQLIQCLVLDKYATAHVALSRQEFPSSHVVHIVPHPWQDFYSFSFHNCNTLDLSSWIYDWQPWLCHCVLRAAVAVSFDSRGHSIHTSVSLQATLSSSDTASSITLRTLPSSTSCGLRLLASYAACRNCCISMFQWLLAHGLFERSLRSIRRLLSEQAYIWLEPST